MREWGVVVVVGHLVPGGCPVGGPPVGGNVALLCVLELGFVLHATWHPGDVGGEVHDACYLGPNNGRGVVLRRGGVFLFDVLNLNCLSF